MPLFAVLMFVNFCDFLFQEQQKQIDKTVEKTEEERTRLIELIKSLEIKLNSVEQTSTEEQWNLRQKAATLDAERVAFEREKTFTRDKHAADEKRIQACQANESNQSSPQMIFYFSKF